MGHHPVRDSRPMSNSMPFGAPADPKSDTEDRNRLLWKLPMPEDSRERVPEGPGGVSEASRVSPGGSRGAPGRLPEGSRGRPGGGPGRPGGPWSAQGGPEGNLEKNERVRDRFGADFGANLGASGGPPWANLGPFFEHRFRKPFRSSSGTVLEPFQVPKMVPKRRPKGFRRSPERVVQNQQKYAKTHGFFVFFASRPPQRWLRNWLFVGFRSEVHTKTEKRSPGARCWAQLGLPNGPKTAPKAIKNGMEFRTKF